jgi:hypothetical protein
MTHTARLRLDGGQLGVTVGCELLGGVKRRIFVLEQVAEESHGICSTCRNRGDRLLTLDRSLVIRARLSAAALFAMKHISQPLPAH